MKTFNEFITENKTDSEESVGGYKKGDKVKILRTSDRRHKRFIGKVGTVSGFLDGVTLTVNIARAKVRDVEFYPTEVQRVEDE